MLAPWEHSKQAPLAAAVVVLILKPAKVIDCRFDFNWALACGNGGSSYLCPSGTYQTGSSCSGTGTTDTQTCQGEHSCLSHAYNLVCANGPMYLCSPGFYKSGTSCTGALREDTQTCQGAVISR